MAIPLCRLQRHRLRLEALKTKSLVHHSIHNGVRRLHQVITYSMTGDMCYSNRGVESATIWFDYSRAEKGMAT